MAIPQGGWVQTLTVTAKADLTDRLFKVVSIGGTIAANATTAIGVLVTRTSSGNIATVEWLGKMRGFAGLPINEGARLQVANSGFLTTLALSGTVTVGKALEAANSGDLFSFLGNFANGGTAYT